MLKQLKLRANLKEQKRVEQELRAQKVEFEKRAEELKQSLEESKTQEDIDLVTKSIEDLEKEVLENNVDEKISEVTSEIKKIEQELSEIDDKTDEVVKTDTKEERGIKKVTNMQVRELLKTGEYYERAEVKNFYEKFKNLRAVTGEGLTIPQIVIDRIMDIVGDYATLYPLVNKIKVKGTARILLDTDTSAATWIEQSGALPVGDVGTITNVDFDGFKIGKVTFVDNYLLQDSIINIDAYVTKKIARAIALGLDLAILKGTGSANKQPDGIIPKLSNDHKVTVTTGKLVDIVKPIALVDTGKDSVGEIVSIMHRKTYYNRFLEYSINVDSKGNMVGKLPNLKSPDLLGLRVVFNNNMDENEVLFGDMEKYTLVEREDITIDKSEHVKFTEDQMGFRGKGRFDGKPVDPNAFVLVTIADTSSAKA